MQPSVGSIAALLCWSGPTAIIWVVSLGVIDPVQCLSFWAFTHVFKEVVKAFPAVADRRVCVSCLVLNPAVHALPAGIRGRNFSVGAVTVAQ